jgi:hypothetical protein
MKAKQLKKFDDLIGKTICNYHLDGDEIYFRFTDDTFAVIEMDDISSPYGHGPKYEAKISTHNTSETDEALVELGIITEGQYREACRKQEEKWKREEEEREARYKNQQTKKDLEAYLQLQKKLGIKD